VQAGTASPTLLGHPGLVLHANDPENQNNCVHRHRCAGEGCLSQSNQGSGQWRCWSRSDDGSRSFELTSGAAGWKRAKGLRRPEEAARNRKLFQQEQGFRRDWAFGRSHHEARHRSDLNQREYCEAHAPVRCRVGAEVTAGQGARGTPHKYHRGRRLAPAGSNSARSSPRTGLASESEAEPQFVRTRATAAASRAPRLGRMHREGRGRGYGCARRPTTFLPKDAPSADR
jgi:hypothetical protein